MLTDGPDTLLSATESLLERKDQTKDTYRAVLDRILRHFECVVGTIHQLDATAGLLELVACRGIPDGILDRVRAIPIGKGMAGLAAERREPVQVCNLQADESGVAKPGAKETEMAGSIAVPMLVDGQLCGTLGVAKPVDYTFDDEEVQLLLRVAAIIGRDFA